MKPRKEFRIPLIGYTVQIFKRKKYSNLKEDNINHEPAIEEQNRANPISQPNNNFMNTSNSSFSSSRSKGRLPKPPKDGTPKNKR